MNKCQNCGKELTQLKPKAKSYGLKRSFKPKIKVCQECYLKGLEEESQNANMLLIVFSVFNIFFSICLISHTGFGYTPMFFLILGVSTILNLYIKKRTHRKTLSKDQEQSMKL